MNGIDIYYQTQRGRMVKRLRSMRHGGAQELQRLAQAGLEAEARDHRGEVVGGVWRSQGRTVWAADLTA